MDKQNYKIEQGDRSNMREIITFKTYYFIENKIKQLFFVSGRIDL